MNKKKKNTYYILGIILLLIGIGYASLTAVLKVNGTIGVDSSSWDIHFENVDIKPGSVTANPAPTSNNIDTTELEYAISFTNPGDFYEFTVDAVNSGTIDVMTTLVENKVYESNGETERNLPAYLKSTVTYADDVPIGLNQLLEAEHRVTYKVRVEFRKDIDSTDLPTEVETIKFKFKAEYKQSEDDVCEKPTTFENDSWDTIACNIKNGNLDAYPVGATKTIQMDIDNDTVNETYTLRVANNTRPEICATTGFSQTACGFVVEFKDIITKQQMNSTYTNGTTNGNGNKGGWEYSNMRAYLNNKKYLEGQTGEIDYTSSGLYEKLPVTLKNKIIKTKVISGHGDTDTSNFETEDYLYLLSPKEIYNDFTSINSGIDTASSQTRQLDYYNKMGIDINHYTGAIKNYNGSAAYWYTRSPKYTGEQYNATYFYYISFNGNPTDTSAAYSNGVSPAFRIG